MKDALDGIVIILATAGELSGVATILGECGGLHRIELLQRHSHKAVRSKAAQILELLSPNDVQNQQNVNKENGYEQNVYEQNGYRQHVYEENVYWQSEHTWGKRGSKKRKGARTGNIGPGRGRKDPSL